MTIPMVFETTSRRARRRCGFTVLELSVTLVIMAMISSVVLSLLDQITMQSRTLDDRMTRRSEIEHCLSRMMEDIATGGSDIQITIDDGVDMTGSRLSIVNGGDEAGFLVARQIDWVALPRYEEQDMVLLRREKRHNDEQEALYIPLCENLYSFQVELLNGLGEVPEDPNDPNAPKEPTPIIEVTAQLYPFDSRDAGQVLTFRRTFCVRRF